MATISLRNINPARFDYNVYMMSSVGIGTASPAYQVDIENSSNAVLRLHAGTNASASVRLKNDAQDWDVNCQVTDKFAIYNQTAGVQAFTIDTSNNVGIGTTAPTYKLHVKDNNSAVAMGEYAAGAVIWMDGANGDLAGGDYFGIHARDAGAALDFSYASTNRLSILAGGNVGIGISSPVKKLQVDGACMVKNNYGYVQYDSAANAATILNQNASDLLTVGDATHTEDIYLATAGNVGIGTTAPAGLLHLVQGSTTVPVLRLVDAGVANYDFVFPDTSTVKFVTNTSSTKDFIINNEGAGAMNLIVQDGKVGIGTTAPATNLHIEDPTLAELRMHHTGGQTLTLSTNDGNGKVTIQSNSTLSIQPAGDVWLARQSGLVGIGTTSPAYKLDVNGTVRCNTLIFADGTSFSSVGQVGMKALAVNIGNGSANVVTRAQSIVNASYGGIQNGMVVVYYHWYYTYGCGNSTCGATATRRNFYQVVNGTWTLHFTSG